MVQRGKEWGKVVGKVVYSMNLGRGSKRKGRGKVVGKVVSRESKTYSINLGRGSKRKGRGEVLVQTGYPAPTLVEKGKQ